MIHDRLYEEGLELRRRMFGSAGAEGQTESTTELDDKLQEIVTRWCFGDLWQREDLGTRDRSLITVAMLLALGRSPEANTHMRGALANGVTPAELREVCLHALLYAGIPAAVDGLRILQPILAERGETDLLTPIADPS
ncbi:carboxymuconolactone decarboxylase family protein [Microbacterium tumbae]